MVACDGFTTRWGTTAENRTPNPILTRRPSAACVTHRRYVSFPTSRTVPAMDAAASQPTRLQRSELAHGSLRATSQLAQGIPHCAGEEMLRSPANPSRLSRPAGASGSRRHNTCRLR